MKQFKRRTPGFTLIETMVALVVLSVGLLGIAGLYIVSLRSGSGAIYRFQAINYASDLADRIRVNSTVADSYQNGVATDNACALGKACTAQEMAEYDLFLWQKDVQLHLPKGTTKVTCAPCAIGAPRNLLIEIDWLEPSTNLTLNYTLNLQI